MRNKCTKCDKELGIYDRGLCYDCKWKEEKLTNAIMVGAVCIAFLIIFGIKLMWAKYAYDDYRCVFSECRLLKK